MSGYYRIGKPGEDMMAHLNFGGRRHAGSCTERRFPDDDVRYGQGCGRVSIALCDADGCDRPICDLHRTKHATKANTDYCSEHKALAG